MSTVRGKKKKRGSFNPQLLKNAASKRQKVSNPGARDRVGRAIHIKPQHAVAVDGKDAFIQETMTPAPSTTALQNTAHFSFIVENDSVGILQDATLRFTVVENGTGTFTAMPTSLWWDRIEFHDRHSGQEIARYHGDVLWWLMWAQNSKENLKNWERVCSFGEKGTISSEVHGLSETRNYYLPLVNNFLEDMALDLSLLRGDIEIKMFPKGDIKTDSTATGVPNVTEIRLISGTEIMTQGSRLIHRSAHAQATQAHNYLDFQRFTETGRVMAANTAYTFDLDQFQHDSAFLVVCIRSGIANEGALQYRSIGERGTIDHENVHGRSMLGDGTPLDEAYMKSFVGPKLFGNDFTAYNSVYIIPFTHDFAKALNGIVDGSHEFKGDRERLRITTGAAAVNEQQTVTWVTAPPAAADYVRVGWKGEWSAPILANTVVATVENTFNALSTVIADDLEVDVTNTFDAGGTIFELRKRGSADQYVNSEGAIVQVSVQGPLNGASASDGGSFAVTQEAVPGFTAGTYQIDIYSAFYRQVQQTDGRLLMEDI